MCEPTTALMVLTAASTAAQVVQQKQMADAQSTANDQQYQNIMTAYRENLAQTNLMQSQEQAAASQKINENNRAAQAAQARAATAAGESGVSGLSVDALLADLAGQQSRYNDSVQQNYENASMAIENQRQNVRTNAASQINNLRTPAQPDYLGAALRIGDAAYRYQNPKVNNTR